MKRPCLSGLLTALTLTTALSSAMEPSISHKPFGTLKSGKAVEIHHLDNGKGVRAGIITLGGIIVSLEVPDRDGRSGDIVLGFDTLAEYEAGHPFFGCITGRYANRIAKGRFTLDGREYQVPVNNGPNSLHGGNEGFDKKVWNVRASEVRDGRPTLVLTYTSPDGEEGYPGKLDTTVTYQLTPEGELRIDYEAVTDKPTVVNLTNHTYFNLAGDGSGPVSDHLLTLHCSRYTDTDPNLIPTGELKPVAGTPLDFRKPERIGARIDQTDFKPLEYGAGYDHNFVIDGAAGTLRRAARVEDPSSGRVMECLTTAPAVQLYTANHMTETIRGKGGRTYGRRGALCLETQHYPDSPNHPDFPSTVLRPGETYRHTTVYRFSTSQ